MSLAEQEIMLRQLTQRPVFEALSPQVQDVMLDAVKRIDSAGKQMHLLMSVGMVMVIYDTITAFPLERKVVWPARWSFSKVSHAHNDAWRGILMLVHQGLYVWTRVVTFVGQIAVVHSVILLCFSNNGLTQTPASYIDGFQYWVVVTGPM